MALVIVSRGTLATSGLRIVTTRTLTALAGALTLSGLLGGIGLGVLLDDATGPDAGPPPEFATLDPDRPESQAFIREIASLSGRLVRLEALASRLTKSVDAPRPSIARASDSRANSVPQSAGGPLLDESGDGASLLQLDRDLDGIESRLDLVASMVARRDLDRMAFPSRSPIPGIAKSSGFGRRIDPFTRRPARHTGFDYVAAYGTPVLASAGGRVRRAGTYGAFGRTVEIDHGDGLVTRYGHLSRLLVRVGDIVLPGQPIGALGSTGRSTGPHVHFEILRDGTQVHPDLYLAGDGR